MWRCTLLLAYLYKFNWVGGYLLGIYPHTNTTQITVKRLFYSEDINRKTTLDGKKVKKKKKLTEKLIQ